MRIALVSTPFVAVPPAGYGGTELVVHALGQALVAAGHDVTVFATGDSRWPDLRALFPTPVWPPDPYAEALHCRFAAREIAGERFDVVHAHVPGMVAFADDLETPLVYTVHHDADPALARLYAASPDVWHVAISARQAALAPHPVRAVVHHGLDPGPYAELGPGGNFAFFLGRLSWVKGPEIAIEAARRAGLRIVVAGQAHPDDAPARWADDVLVPALAGEHVEWLGEADLAAKRRLFGHARALLVPLRWEEPFGLVMIEALLAGCPVVAYARGAAPEIVEDGVNGFLVGSVRDMATALRRCAELDRREIQARARERFSAERMAREYVQVYARAVAERARTALPTAPEGEWTTLAQ